MKIITVIILMCVIIRICDQDLIQGQEGQGLQDQDMKNITTGAMMISCFTAAVRVNQEDPIMTITDVTSSSRLPQRLKK